MFKTGEIYQFIMGSGDDWSQETFEVLEIELPLLKVKSRTGGESIINTASPNFQRANLIDYEKIAARLRDDEERSKSLVGGDQAGA